MSSSEFQLNSPLSLHPLSAEEVDALRGLRGVYAGAARREAHSAASMFGDTYAPSGAESAHGAAAHTGNAFLCLSIDPIEAKPSKEKKDPENIPEKGKRKKAEKPDEKNSAVPRKLEPTMNFNDCIVKIHVKFMGTYKTAFWFDRRIPKTVNENAKLQRAVSYIEYMLEQKGMPLCDKENMLRFCREYSDTIGVDKNICSFKMNISEYNAVVVLYTEGDPYDASIYVFAN